MQNLQAQVSNELGASIGFCNYLGDLQDKDLTFKSPGFSFGLTAKHTFSSMFALRGNFNVGRISGNDELSNKLKNRNRNLSFRSHIIELGVVAEISALPFDKYNHLNSSNKRYFNWTPYFVGGLNLFHFNPKARYEGVWVPLRPLGTEGQNTSFNSQREYSLTQVGLPFGLGLKFQLSSQICVAFEIGARKTFTDYLDDVSGLYPDQTLLQNEKGKVAADLSYRGDELTQGVGVNPTNSVRGNSANMDWYTMNTLTFTYKFYKN